MNGREQMPGDPAILRDGETEVGGWEETPVARGRRVLIEYIGRTALVVTGPYTGELYRFGQPGTRVPVDPRDRQSLLSLPVLRSVAV